MIREKFFVAELLGDATPNPIAGVAFPPREGYDLDFT